MVQRIKHKIVNNQLTVFSLLITGLGLIGLAVVLITRLLEYGASVPQYVTLLFVFLLVSASLGFLLIVLGCYGAIKNLQMKGMSHEIEKELTDFSPSAGRGGLQIVRPGTVRTTDTAVQEERVVKKSSVKEEKKPVTKSVGKPTEKSEPAKVSKKEDIDIGDFSYEDGLQNIVDRYNTEKVKKAFRNWYNTLMMTFPDISKSYLFVINGDEGINLSEGTDEEAAVQVKMDSTIFVKMMTKQINPIKAYSSGSLEVKGEMKNMLKLRKLMF